MPARRGRPPAKLPSQHIADGTFQACRHGDLTETLPNSLVVSPSDLPIPPEWLTEAGREVWDEDIGRVSSIRMVTELDSTMFAQYCNLQGATVACWRSGEVPPAAHLNVLRLMSDAFGLYGRKSRVMQKGSASDTIKQNPFLKNRGPE
jgi:hypothetical protein